MGDIDLSEILFYVLLKSKELIVIAYQTKQKQKNVIPLSFRSTITHVDSGNQHTCALKEIQPISSFPDSYELGCWGGNTFGQVDIPSSFLHSAMIALGE